MADASIELPYPPSVNNLFSQTKTGRRFPSSRYVRWKKAAGLTIMASRVRPFKCPVAIVVHLTPADMRRRDADNAIKPILDSLVAAGIISDDGRDVVKDVRAVWTDTICRKNPHAIVEITRV